MRAPPLLLLLALGAAAASAPALLVLRAACPPGLAAFDRALHEASSALAGRALRPLGHRETCGPEWRTWVTRGALGALAEGGSVLSAGRLGGVVCDALAAAAHALRRAAPEHCAGGAARGAAVARLAVRLGWRRALLASAADAECSFALRDAARALAAAGLAVWTAPVTVRELTRRPHVVILCASMNDERREAGTFRWGSVGTGPPALLLHLADDGEAPVSFQNVENAFKLSNNTFTVDSSRKRDIRKSFSDDDANVDGGDDVFISLLRREDSLSTVASFNMSEPKKYTPPIDLLRSNATNLTIKDKSIHIANDTYVGNGSRSRRESSRAVVTDIKTFLRFFILQEKYAFFQRLLVLTDESPEIYRYDLKQVLDRLARAAEDESKTNRTRIQYAPINFQLLERTNGTPAAWKRVAILSTTSTRSLDLSTEWVTSVDIRNASAALESWSALGGGAGGAGGGGAAALSALAACGALLLAAGAALLARWAAVRRKGRRRRRDVLLLPGDFTFPVDERRRVGEGMETMLSCWLQQLHEFGGPELERPDLLKQPPHAAPKAPSAPSSTCSVNRVAAADRRIRYKGDVVHVKYLPVTGTLELKRKVTDVLLVMQNLRHENLNPFIGCLCELRPALVFDHCFRGSLEDVLMADEIKLDWTFRLSLLTDLVKGMRYLHASTLRVHGRLTSRNVVVDSRWVLRVTDHGLPALSRAMGLSLPPRSTRELLWTAPELLREERGEGRGTQAGDVFSFAIIMQEVIVRGEPYCMLSLTPDEIVEKLCRPPPLIRPSVSMGAAPPEAVSVMRQCWSEAPDLRPDFHRLHDIFRHLHRGRKINIVDSMFEMLEKYSNNLEELIKERTEQLDMEKKKTEQLLNRMLPRSVAERLLLGSRVEPEEFEEVSIYFSDIVGFTALAARSTPVQVVDMLNELYTAFDATIEQYRVYKVETIGDAYMVVGGLPVRTPDHAEAVATMALHLLHLAGRFRLRHLPDQALRLRIGLHSGACCAGVVGLTMPRYCLFGDTVNTASRMESTGAAWRIQVSATTAERLTAAGGYRLRSRGLTQIKGKGAMHTYWLLGKDGFDKPLPTPPPLEDEEVLFEVEGENECESTVAAPPAASPRAPVVERQRSDPSAAPDRHAWQRSGAVSADSSPPRRDAREPRHSLAPPAHDHAAPYARYRCLGNGRRPLRRQWSLERGDALAAAAAGVAMGAAGVAPASAPPSPPEPLALLAAAPRAPAARYRTRRERDATEAAL